MRKFRRAQVQNQASVEKHLEAHKFRNLESSSSEDEQVLETTVKKVLSSYQSEGGDVKKTLSYLTETFQSGGAVCLICISSVKKSDAIWNCAECFTFMHLPCIQHWVRDSLSSKHEKGIISLWGCPKCRKEYGEDQIPKKYRCFCGKTEDPPYQPWSIPHSCGDICGKLLLPKCGHKCMLLCHPGPCPPCPKMVSVTCFCAKQSPCPRRCNAKEWSCGIICNKKYKTCEHACVESCHPGPCLPCAEKVLTACNCRNKSELKKCNESFWQCNKVCRRRLSCNVHVCKDFCHNTGDCNTCPLEQNRTCPCGKKRYAITCKQQQVPTCGDTCGKLLDCGAHYCNMRCHTERCGPCLEVVTKLCRCGSFSKELSCTKEFHCNKKCSQMRLCTRHLCNKKCCDCVIKNTFKACEKVCDNTLNCRKHKCSAPCHNGPCYPCPCTIVIQCRCGKSKITVPCGTNKKIKPPSCNKMCKIPPICHHLKRESHKCHQGACPPCRKTCKLIHKKCGHACQVICHTKVWTKVKPNGVTKPIGPWENHKEKWEYQSLPCPPCEVFVMVTCLGEHETLPWPCYKAVSTSCLRECGKLLMCTNHYCEKPCHKLNSLDDDDEDKCIECEKPCSFPRPKGCTHACPKLCHSIPCEPCKQLVKIVCLCGINTLYIRCAQLTSATTDKRNELLQCGNQCPQNYPCGHRCTDNCHPGLCKKAQFCSTKVKIFCNCKRLKKYFSCNIVQTGKVYVECDSLCQKRKEELDKIKETELKKKQKEEELKNLKEIEIFEKKFKPKRRGKEHHLNKKLLNNKTSSCKLIWMFTGLAIGISVVAMLIFQNNL